MRSIALRVSLADCCALGGKGTGGLKTPGYSKTVLRTENAAATPHVILLSLWSIIPRTQYPHPA